MKNVLLGGIIFQKYANLALINAKHVEINLNAHPAKVDTFYKI